MTVRQIVWLKVAAVAACCLQECFKKVCEAADAGVCAAVDEYLCTCAADTEFLRGLCGSEMDSRAAGGSSTPSSADAQASAPHDAPASTPPAPAGTTPPRPAGK